jgi:POT family proton-dependent oligopeptide transporter
VVGPLTDLAFAAQTFGLYSGFIYATPLIGAWLGDRVLGRTRTITIGTFLMSAGHLTMAFEQSFLIALLLLVLGAGCLIGNLSAQVGLLYAPQDTRRTRAFGIYLIALNIGALVAPLIVGSLGEDVGWHWGFGAAGIGMVLGLFTYLAGRPHLPPDHFAERTAHVPLDRNEWTVIGAILVTFLPRLLGTAAYQQAYGLMMVWADKAVNRNIGSFEMPVTWIGTFDGLFTILGVFVANALWRMWAARGREPNDLLKIAIGEAMAAVALIYIGLAATLAQVPLLAWILFYLILGLCYGWLDPPQRSITTRYAPVRMVGTMVALLSMAGSLGYFLLGWLGRFYEPLGAPLYFMLLAALPATASAILALFNRPLLRLLGRAEREHEAELAAPYEA